ACRRRPLYLRLHCASRARHLKKSQIFTGMRFPQSSILHTRGSSRSFSSVRSGKRLQDLLYSADPREAWEDSLKGKAMLFGILAGAGVFNYDEREAQARPLTQR